MKKNFLNHFKKLVFVATATLLAVSCQNEKQDTLSNNDEMKRLGVPEFSESYLKSIDPLSPAEYERNIQTLRPDISSDQMRATATIPATYNLPAMPIGDQGAEGSCVSFGVGYAGHSITRYINNSVHQKNWDSATRSAAFIYNQIKISDCAGGSYPQDAMNLLARKGECSVAEMPYVEGGCYTMPNTKQFELAAKCKISNWKNISARNVDDIKYYLSKNYPVPACFDYNASFKAISRNNYVWSSVYGQRTGGHCVCIVGYNDITKMFKVQNSWGKSWGKSGYFYVTYDAIKKGAFNWAAIMFPTKA